MSDPLLNLPNRSLAFCRNQSINLLTQRIKLSLYPLDRGSLEACRVGECGLDCSSVAARDVIQVVGMLG